MARGAADFQYQHVQKRTWTDRKFKRLSPPPPCGRYLWFFLMTGEYTTKIPGVNAGGGRTSMAEFLEWPLEDFDRCFDEIADQRNDDGLPMAVADWPNRLVYLTSAFKQPDNHPHSTAEVVSWRKFLNNLPECDLRDRIEYDLRIMLMDHPPAFLTSFVQNKRTDLFSKRDDTKVLPASSSTGLPAALETRSPFPDPLPLPLPLPLPKNTSPSADAAGGEVPPESSSNGVQRLLLEPTAMQPSFDIEQAFKEAYALYPRKLGKRKGEARFGKQITTQAKFERFVQSVRNYIELVTAERRKPEHVKQFDTFMNDWEDYAPENWHGSPPSASATLPDLARGQVPVAKGLDYSKRGTTS